MNRWQPIDNSGWLYLLLRRLDLFHASEIGAQHLRHNHRPVLLHIPRPSVMNTTSFYGSSSANNGKDALNTP
eukprot:5988662-Pyramimonas_sp.AAC.1